VEFSVDLFLGVEDLDSEDVAQAQGLLVYPNPVTDANFTLQSQAMKGDFQLQVFDLTGRLNVDQSIRGYVGGPLTVDASNLPNGQYIVRLVNGVSQPCYGCQLYPSVASNERRFPDAGIRSHRPIEC